MIIAIGSDNTAYALKLEIKKHIEALGHTALDCGSHSDERCDYPVYGKLAAEAVLRGEANLAVLICGTGVGISLAANKLRGIRCGVCSEPYTAQLSRRHNNANAIAFGARVVGVELAKMIVEEFLNAEFEGGRHADRVAMLE
ncbi:ribose 5-phosphate isomerase B [Clostridia bacterium]|nr:ribose 5-phosphate isomerase B [Clostridia bacterium]